MLATDRYSYWPEFLEKLRALSPAASLLSPPSIAPGRTTQEEGNGRSDIPGPQRRLGPEPRQVVPETPHGNLNPLRSPPRGAAESWWRHRDSLIVSHPSPVVPGPAQRLCGTHPALQKLRAFFSSAAILHQS